MHPQILAIAARKSHTNVRHTYLHPEDIVAVLQYVDKAYFTS